MPHHPAERLSGLITESASDGIIGMDAECRCQYINQSAAELIGGDPDDLVNMPLTELFDLGNNDHRLDLARFHDGQPIEYHNATLHRSDGLEVPVELSIMPHVEPSGEVTSAIVRFSDLRAAAAAARQSEARHQAFLEVALDSIVTIDQDGRIQEFNQAAERTFKHSLHDVLGQDFAETLISPAWRQWWNEAIDAFLQYRSGPLTGRRVQITAMRSDGTHFPADLTLTPIPTGESWILTLYIHDLTSQRWSEQRQQTRYLVTRTLAETESSYEAFPKVLKVLCEGLEWDWAAFWTRTPGSNKMAIELTWRPETLDAPQPLEDAIRTSGFNPGEGFLGAVWMRQQPDSINDLTQPNTYQRSDLAIASGFRSLVALPVSGRSEVVGIIELLSYNRREHNPALLRLLDSLGTQVGQFIERKQVEEERVQLLAREQAARAEAEAAERRLAFLAEASAQLSTSLDYEVTLANVARLAVPRLADFCAIDMFEDDNQIRSLELADIDPEKEERGRLIRESHPIDPESKHPVAQVLRTGRPILFSEVDDSVLRLLTEDDEEYLNELKSLGVDSSIYVPLVARGRAIGVISFVSSESGRRYGPSDLALAQELTRRAALAIDNARLYREAQEAVRIREEFLSIASHELKTPLTTVKGYGQILSRLLRRPDLEPDRLIRMTDQLQDQLVRFETLIADLLDVSRIQQRGLELRPEPTDLAELVRTVVNRFEDTENMEDRHSFRIIAPDQLHGVWDPDRLDQVLTNLVSNAVKYSPDGGEITITLGTSDDDHVEFAVSDQGIGIPEEEQAQLFRPFARSETVLRAISGVGLGLYISRQIITRHGGDIWLESKPGSGSRFSVRIPRDVTADQIEPDADADPDHDETG